MAKYRKKPVVIEAVPVRMICKSAKHDWKSLPFWVEEKYNEGKIIFCEVGISIATLEGELYATIDDMLIKGIKGEIYPCKPDIFKETYEEIK